MSKYRAIPKGYITVGELAKKMGTTVRTLQYYDKEGLLLPSAESEGGRRLYTDKDFIKLYQILSLKSLGFSLDDIKNNINSLDTPAEVVEALSKQAAAIREKMKELSESLTAVETLQSEVQQMQSVDFKKYADIIVNIQIKNEFYWMIKHFDDKTLDHMRNRFSKDNGLAMTMMETFTRLYDEAIQLQEEGVPPESEKGQDLAEAFWNMIIEFTGGDMSILPKLMEAESINSPDNEWEQKQTIAKRFIEPALDAYLTALNYNPFEEGDK